MTDEILEVELRPVQAGAAERRRRPRRALILLAIVVAIAGGAAFLASGTIRLGGRTPASHRPSRIAFVDASGALSTIVADGTDRRTYQVPDVVFLFPAWSPDGSHLASVAASTRDGEVVILDDRPSPSATATPVVAYRSERSPIYLYWSPSGGRIAFLTNEADGLALQVVAADGSAPAAVVRRGQPRYWDWVDGDHLLVHSGGDAPQAFLGEVGVDAPDAAPVAATLGAFQAPAVSTGGRFRAYVAADASGSASVVVEGRDGSGRHAAALQGPSALEWSPARDELAYLAPTQANLPIGALRILDAHTGASRQVLDGLVVAYFWSPDARTIAAIRFVLPSDNTTAGGGAATTVAARPIAKDERPARRLVFVDPASGTTRSELPIRLPDTFLGQFLPYFDQYARSHRLWSPSSDAIVLPLLDGAGTSHITIVPADGSAPRQVADGIAAFWSP